MSKVTGKKRLSNHEDRSQDDGSDDCVLDDHNTTIKGSMSKVTGKKRLMKHKDRIQDEDSDDGFLDNNKTTITTTTNNMSKVTGKKRLMKHKGSSQDEDSDDDLFNSVNKSTKMVTDKDYLYQSSPGPTLESIIIDDNVHEMLNYLFTFNITNCTQKECLFITIYDLLLLCCQHNATSCMKQLINTKHNKLLNTIKQKNDNTLQVGERSVFVDLSIEAYMPFALLLDGNKDLYYPESYNLLPYTPSQLMSPLFILLMNYQNVDTHNDTLGSFASQYPMHCMQLLKLKICMESREINRQFPPLLLQLVSDSSYFSICVMIVAMNDRLSGRRSDDCVPTSDSFSKHADVLKLLRFKDKNDGATMLHYAAEEGITALVNILLSLDCTLAKDEDSEGITPLMSACMVGNTDVVKELLPVSMVMQTDKSGWTAFLYALYSEQADCVLCILQDNMNTILIQFQALNNFILSSMDHKNTSVDGKIKKCLEAIAIVPEINNLLNNLVTNDPTLLHNDLQWLLAYPFLLSLENKLLVARMLCVAMADANEVAGFPILSVTCGCSDILSFDRASPWQGFILFCEGNNDTDCNTLTHSTANSSSRSFQISECQSLLKRDVIFQFRNEIGIGRGVEREVIELLCRGMTSDDKVSIFNVTTTKDRINYTVMSSSSLNNNNFVAFGQLIGHMLLRCISPQEHGNKFLPLSLSSLFWKILLNGKESKITLEDVANEDTSMHQSLCYILENNNVEELDLTFTASTFDDATFQRNSSMKNITKLIANGDEIKVTDENKKKYVDLMIKHCTLGRMLPSISLIRKGIFNIIPSSVLKLFKEKELNLLLSPSRSGTIDTIDWRRHTVYSGGYSVQSPTILSFWKVLKRLSATEKGLLLLFCTGMSSIGTTFEKLSPPFTITKVPYDANKALPTVSTCFNLLKLPDYPTELLLKKSLLTAILYGSEGFSFS